MAILIGGPAAARGLDWAGVAWWTSGVLQNFMLRHQDLGSTYAVVGCWTR